MSVYVPVSRMSLRQRRTNNDQALTEQKQQEQKKTITTSTKHHHQLERTQKAIEREARTNDRKRDVANVRTHVNVCFTDVKNAFSTFSRYPHEIQNQYNISPRTE